MAKAKSKTNQRWSDVYGDSFAKTELRVKFGDEMADAYVTYALSTLNRAIPSVFDGLKISQRRLLYGAHAMGARSSGRTIKCAKIAGYVQGNLHPHGSAYGALVNMAAPHLNIIPYFDFQGNGGSLDDGPAADRYTEAKLSRFAERLFLDDLNKATARWIPTYDSTEQEPVELPSRIPAALLYEQDGIGVGYATSTMAFSVEDVVSATLTLMGSYRKLNGVFSQEAHEEARQFLVPQYPLGPYVLKDHNVEKAIREGRGSVTQRARYELTELDGQPVIVFKNLPRMGMDATVDHLNRLARSTEIQHKPLRSIDIVQNTTDSNGYSLEIWLKTNTSDSVAHQVAALAYAETDLERSSKVSALYLVDGIPKYLSPTQVIELWIPSRLATLKAKFQDEADAVAYRIHILQGLEIIYSNLDRAIEIIRASESPAKAKSQLIAELSLTEVQASAVLALRLSQLTRLDEGQIKAELSEKLAEHKRLMELVTNEAARIDFIEKDIAAFAEEFRECGGTRRSDWLDPSKIVSVQADEHQPQFFIKGNISDKGIGSETDNIADCDLVLKMEDKVIAIANNGMGYRRASWELKYGAIFPIGCFKVAAFRADDGDDKTEFLLLTKNGRGKRMNLAELSRCTKKGTPVIRLDDGDELVYCGIAKGITITTLPHGRGNKRVTWTANADRFPLQGRGTQGNKVENNGVAEFVPVDESPLPGTERPLVAIWSNGEIHAGYYDHATAHVPFSWSDEDTIVIGWTGPDDRERGKRMTLAHLTWMATFTPGESVTRNGFITRVIQQPVSNDPAYSRFQTYRSHDAQGILWT